MGGRRKNRRRGWGAENGRSVTQAFVTLAYAERDPAALLEIDVGDLVCQRVLEHARELREERPFVDQLDRLQLAQEAGMPRTLR